MKKITILTLILIGSLAQTLAAQETYSGSKDGSLDAAGIDQFQISLDNGFTVQIRGSETDQIAYTYSFEGNRLAHEQKFVSADFRLERNGSIAHFQIRFPDLEDLEGSDKSWMQRIFGSGNTNTYTEIQELIIEVPRDLEVQLQSRYSDVNITGIERNVRISNRSGSVAAAELNGNLQVNNEYGNTTAENVEGNVQIESRSADLTLQNIGGSARVNSLYSNLTISNIGNEVEIQTQSGQLEAEQISGPLTVQGDYTSMSINKIEGHVRVRSRSGDLTVSNIPSLEFNGEYTDIRGRQVTGTDGVNIQGRSSTIELGNIRGRAHIAGEYLEIRLENIQEDLSISNRSGSVDASGLEGAVRIDGEYNQIDLANFLGSQLQINNRSEDINVESTGTLSEVNIQVTYGDVTFTLANEFSGEYSLQTQYGELNLDSNIFPAENIDINTQSNHQSVSGVLGSGSNNHFHIRTRNGDIIIRE